MGNRSWKRLAAVLGALGAFLGPAAAFNCTSIDGLRNDGARYGFAMLVQSGPLGRAIAQLHREVTGFEPGDPIETVVLIRSRNGDVTVRLQLGAMACEPLDIPAKNWAIEMLRIRGQGA